MENRVQKTPDVRPLKFSRARALVPLLARGQRLCYVASAARVCSLAPDCQENQHGCVVNVQAGCSSCLLS